MQISVRPGAPIVLSVRVYGHAGTCDLDGLVDTGAIFVTIPREDAARLGYDVAGAPYLTVTTASGTMEAPTITLSRVSVGEFEVRNVQALCVDLELAGFSSILGLSLLSRLNLNLDHKRQTLTITDP